MTYTFIQVNSQILSLTHLHTFIHIHSQLYTHTMQLIVPCLTWIYTLYRSFANIHNYTHGSFKRGQIMTRYPHPIFCRKCTYQNSKHTRSVQIYLIALYNYYMTNMIIKNECLKYYIAPSFREIQLCVKHKYDKLYGRSIW